MNCTQVRDHLPELLYGDVGADEKAGIDEHLAGCGACRREWAALQQVRHLLDAAPAREASVDLARLYQQAAERQQRQARRWRRRAVAFMSAAAVLALVALGLRLEVRLEAHQVVLRWGAPPVQHIIEPAPARPAQLTSPAPQEVERAAATEKQLRLLGELIRAVAEDVDARDRARQQDFARLVVVLQDFQQQSTQRWTATRKDVDGLYTAQFVLPQKGTSP